MNLKNLYARLRQLDSLCNEKKELEERILIFEYTKTDHIDLSHIHEKITLINTKIAELGEMEIK
jgi:hypothetical protein